MINQIKNKVNSFFKVDSQRSKNIQSNVFYSFGIKGGSIVIGFLLVPMTINYVGTVQYGIWLTISSVMTWILYFDIGLGSGLRNKLTFSLAHNQYLEAKIYVSTTYAAISGISFLMTVIFWMVNPSLDWRGFFNVPDNVDDDIELVMLMAVSVFFVQFIAQLINSILSAMQKTAISGFITFIGQLFIFFGILIATKFTSGSLLKLVAILTLCPLTILIISNLYFFIFKFSNISPSFNFIKINYIKNILGLGWMFFLIQLCGMVLYQTSNIILIRMLGPDAVTQYNIVIKLFSVISMTFTIIVTPYWSAFTDAHAKNDILWMRKGIKNLLKIWLFLSFGCVLLLIISPLIYKYWIGDSVKIDFIQSFFVSISVVVGSWYLIYAYFLNGLSRLKFQLIIVFFGSLFNFPLSIYFVEHFGVIGVTMANIIIFLFMGICLKVQVEKILKEYEKV